MPDIKSEIEKRRTFAIISHPDAGKTTLTEKFLLYGGAINLAGSVKGKKTAKHAVSDWMEIEKERGISVTSSVLQFNYGGYCINILSIYFFLTIHCRLKKRNFSLIAVINALKFLAASDRPVDRTCAYAEHALNLIKKFKWVVCLSIHLINKCKNRNMPHYTYLEKLNCLFLNTL